MDFELFRSVIIGWFILFVMVLNCCNGVQKIEAEIRKIKTKCVMVKE